MNNYFMSNLKFLREKKGISQNKLAQMINVNQTTIARWEDENRVPTIEKAIEVSIALNIPLNDLIGKDLRIKENQSSKNISNENELKLLKNILTKKGFLNENEEFTEGDFNRLIEFAKANKPFIMKDSNK